MAVDPAAQPAALVFALVHEVRNLLAATRLRADLLEGEADARERGETGRRIARLSDRAGALLACVRPLLAAAGAERSVDPLELLEGIRRRLDEDAAKRVVFDLDGAARCATARCDPEALDGVLLAAILGALDESGEDVCVSVRRDPDGAALEIEDGARRTGGGPMPCGLELVETVAAALLRPGGGRVERDSRGHRSRTRFVLPVG